MVGDLGPHPQGLPDRGIFIVGTLVTTAVAMLLAVPIGVATAAFLSELAPRWLAGAAVGPDRPHRGGAEHRGGAVGTARA